MSDVTLIASALENILLGSTVTADSAPLTSYDLDTLLTMDPAARVLFGVTSVTITFTVGSPGRLGEIFLLPVSNLVEGGSPSTLKLTTDSGLDVALIVPQMPADGIPDSLAADLTLLDSDESHRTAGVWNLIISGNAANVVLGGAIGIYPRRVLDPDVRMGFSLEETHAVGMKTNEYRSRYVQKFRTRNDLLTASTRCPSAQVAALKDLYRANFGSGDASLIWPQGYVFAPMLATWQETFRIQHVDGTMDPGDYYDVTTNFQECAKGLPV